MKKILLALSLMIAAPAAAQNLPMAVGQSCVIGTAWANCSGTPAHYLSAATTNSTNVKAAPGRLYGFSVINTNAATAYLKFYNKATAPTCNSDTVLMTIALVQNIPVNAPFGPGIGFATGIGFCITANAADNDNTSATTGITLNVIYQ